MIDFSDQTYETIKARQMARVPDIVDKRETSIIDAGLSPESWYFEAFYMVLDIIQKNGFVLTAVGDALDMKAEERGLTRRPATPAVREGVFNVQIPSGSRFNTIDGENSVTFYSDTALSSTDEYYHYRMVCEESGTVGNEYSGAILPLVNITNLNYAQLTNILASGTNEEDDASLLARYRQGLEETAFGGNIASYQEFLLSYPEVGACQIYPAYPDAGYVQCSIIDANYGIAGSDLLERLQLELCPPEIDEDNPSANGYGVAPIGAIATVSTATEFAINITADVQIESNVVESEILPLLNEAIEAYMLSVRRGWGERVITNQVEYPVWVYASRLVVAMLAVSGVVNVSNVTLNGSAGDLEMTETGALQQLPIVGTVNLNVSV